MTDNKQTHWAAQPERGSRLFLALTTLMVRYLPAFFMRPCIWFVVLYFYATAPKPRRHVLRYQTRLQTTFPHIVLPKHSVFKQFVAFGEAVCDRFAVWQRKIRYEDLVIEDPDDIYSQIKRNERGQILPVRTWAIPKFAVRWCRTIKISDSTYWCTANTRRHLTRHCKKPVQIISV